MERVIEAVYQDKVIKPLEEVDLEENERIRVAIIKLGAEEGWRAILFLVPFPSLGKSLRGKLRKVKEFGRGG